MADKIKKFFQKKKVDAKFKMAGPGHKLTDSNSSSHSSQMNVRSESVLMKRSGLTEESKVAAEAALARLQQTRENPQFNTSLAAIRAQVKRELENEEATTSSSTPKTDQLHSTPVRKPSEEGIPKNYVASGVYFKCPMISNEVLPRDEWKRKIKTFLYEQLEEERGLTACLILQSCNHNREKIDTCVETLCKYLENIVQNPTEEKYQKIRMTNRVFTEKVQPLEGALELLLAAGFTQQKIQNGDYEEDFLVFSAENVPSIESLTTLIDALRTAEAIPLELDRNLQVLLPSQAASKVQLPPAFYALTMEEIKREHQLRAEAIEKSQMLRTKAMREKDELREMRKYKFAIIRVRFPDGILLQGTFSVYERYMEIHEFVQENLEHSALPFVLNTPTGHKLLLEEDANKTLIDLRLVPTTVLNFAWHSSVIEEINRSPNKDVFLKPEVMVLVKEV